MKIFTYQHLNSIQIEPDAVILEYSEPDQGGTVLLHRFRIFKNRGAERETGYRHDAELQKQGLSIAEVPQRVFKDALDWINQQMQCTSSEGLLHVLSSLREVVVESLERHQESPDSNIGRV